MLLMAKTEAEGHQLVASQFDCSLIFSAHNCCKLTLRLLLDLLSSAYCYWHVFGKMRSSHAVVHFAALYFSNRLSTSVPVCNPGKTRVHVMVQVQS